MAERVGFEPTWACTLTVFKTASLWPLRYPSRINGWGSRTRTYACQNQNLVPYRLGDTPIFGMPAGIRTPDPRLRRAMLYPAELQTHVVYRSLETQTKWCLVLVAFNLPSIWKNLIGLGYNGAGEGNRTLATGLEGQGSTTELHPHIICFLLVIDFLFSEFWYGGLSDSHKREDVWFSTYTTELHPQIVVKFYWWRRLDSNQWKIN